MDIGKGIQRSIDAYFKNFGPMFLASLVVLLIIAVASVVIATVLGLVLGWVGTLGGILISLVLAVGVPFVAGPFVAGLISLSLKVLRGEKAEFGEIFAHFGKLLPLGVVLGFFGLVSFVFSTIGFIPILGVLFRIALALASPGLMLVGAVSVGLVTEKGLAPLDAIKRAFGCFMTNPLMGWLYAFLIGIIAGLGYLVALIPIGIFTAISIGIFGFLGSLAGVVLVALFGLPCLALTIPVGALGMAAGYEDLSAKEPAPLKLDRQVLQIAGLVLGVLLLLGIVGRLAFHWGSWYTPALGMRGLSFFGRGSGINVDRGNVTVKTKEGTVSIGAQLPADYPRDVPLYPGAKKEGYVGSTSKEGVGSWATLSTRDSVDKVAAYYQEQLAANGWELETLDLGEMKTFTFRKEGREGNVAITKGDPNTSILLTIVK